MGSEKAESSEKVHVRRIKTSDFARLAEILNSAFHKEVSVLGFDSNRLASFKKYHYVIEILYHVFDFLHIDYPTILVAVIGDNVVGEVHLVPLRRHVWTIESLATDPAYASRGVGRSLISGSLEFVSKRKGIRATSSIRTDNTPALRIAEKLGFAPFQKTCLFLYESEKALTEDAQQYFSTRRFKSSDAKEVFNLCLLADSVTVRTLCLSPEDLSTPALESLQNRLQRVQVEKLVLEENGKIVGYASLSYTSSNEAARIERFCLHKTPNAQAARIFLTHILRFLEEKGITKVLITVDENRREIIETLQKGGFRHLASFHEIMKDLSEHERF